VELELTEIEQALSELQKTADDAVIYKAIGTLLVKAEKAKIT
jgi:chaperonin cofactor prefoldin